MSVPSSCVPFLRLAALAPCLSSLLEQSFFLLHAFASVCERENEGGRQAGARSFFVQRRKLGIKMKSQSERRGKERIIQPSIQRWDGISLQPTMCLLCMTVLPKGPSPSVHALHRSPIINSRILGSKIKVPLAS